MCVCVRSCVSGGVCACVAQVTSHATVGIFFVFAGAFMKACVSRNQSAQAD